MKKPRDVIEPRWGVYALRRKAERIGSVLAKDAEEARQRGIAAFRVAERDRFRISVQREAQLGE